MAIGDTQITFEELGVLWRTGETGEMIGPGRFLTFNANGKWYNNVGGCESPVMPMGVSGMNRMLLREDVGLVESGALIEHGWKSGDKRMSYAQMGYLTVIAGGDVAKGDRLMVTDSTDTALKGTVVPWKPGGICVAVAMNAASAGRPVLVHINLTGAMTLGGGVNFQEITTDGPVAIFSGNVELNKADGALATTIAGATAAVAFYRIHVLNTNAQAHVITAAEGFNGVTALNTLTFSGAAANAEYAVLEARPSSETDGTYTYHWYLVGGSGCALTAV